jgi:hypothetical protein
MSVRASSGLHYRENGENRVCCYLTRTYRNGNKLNSTFGWGGVGGGLMLRYIYESQRVTTEILHGALKNMNSITARKLLIDFFLRKRIAGSRGLVN